jgi:hypothetical protein
MIVKGWIEKLKEVEVCGACGSEDVCPVIIPYPYEYKSPEFKEANSKRGIMICCADCGALAVLTAEELEN